MLLTRLRRITRDGRWIPEIDGLRFVAIVSVLLFHLSGELINRSGRIIPIESRFWWLDRLLGNGDRGVSLFFVISGMILALPFARQHLLASKPVALRKYYLRRVTRLEPPYVLSTLLILSLAAIYQHGLHLGIVSHLLASLFYQHSLVYGEASSINPVAWSLEVEIQFYLLAPVFMQLFRIRQTTLRRSLMLASILVVGIAQQPFQPVPRVTLSILFYLQYFIAGLLVADIFVLDLDSIPSSLLWDALGTAALACIFWFPHEAFWAHVVLPFLIAVLTIAALRSYLLRRIFATPFIAILGGMCYSIYLLHLIFIAAIFKITRYAILPGAAFPENFALQVVLTGVPACLLCTLFFVLIERPCMDPEWPLKLWHRTTGRAGAEVKVLDTEGVS